MLFLVLKLLKTTVLLLITNSLLLLNSKVSIYLIIEVNKLLDLILSTIESLHAQLTKAEAAIKEETARILDIVPLLDN